MRRLTRLASVLLIVGLSACIPSFVNSEACPYWGVEITADGATVICRDTPVDRGER